MENVVLELIACNLINLNKIEANVELVHHMLPEFFDSGTLNQIEQITKNDIEKVDEDAVGSDYSSNYDSDMSDQSFDLSECENHYINSSSASMTRPTNYSYYLKSIKHERGRRLRIAKEKVSRKLEFIYSLRYHRCFLHIACYQQIYRVHGNFDGYVCPW